MQSLTRVLLVEDDRSIAGALAHALHNTYEIDVATSGKAGIYKSDRDHYDIIILDLGLPDMDGLSICQQFRERGQTAPILILSGNTNVLSKISLLDAGANDYLTKPVTLGELKARLRVLERLHPSKEIREPKPELSAYGLVLNRVSHTASRMGTDLKLRRKEFALLECLMEHAGMLVSRSTLVRHAWSEEELWTNTVDVHIKYLRDKVDRPFGEPLIHTIHGLGYRFGEPNNSTASIKANHEYK